MRRRWPPLRAVQCVGVKGSQAADLFPKLSGAAFGVAVTGDQSELALHLAERVFRALDAVAHTLTGDAGVLGDLGKAKDLHCNTDQTARAASR